MGQRKLDENVEQRKRKKEIDGFERTEQKLQKKRERYAKRISEQTVENIEHRKRCKESDSVGETNQKVHRRRGDTNRKMQDTAEERETSGTKAKKCKEKIFRNYGPKRKKTTGSKESQARRRF